MNNRNKQGIMVEENMGNKQEVAEPPKLVSYTMRQNFMENHLLVSVVRRKGCLVVVYSMVIE